MILLDVNFYIGIAIGGLFGYFVLPLIWSPKK